MFVFVFVCVYVPMYCYVSAGYSKSSVMNAALVIWLVH